MISYIDSTKLVE